MNPTLHIALSDAAATHALGGAVAEVVERGDVLLLVGELGAGKTTFTKGLVAALGCADEVTSPTFTLLHCYPSNPPVAHVDCWRLSELSEVADLGLEEVLDDGGVAVIEWGELAAPFLGQAALTLSLELVEDEGGTEDGGSTRVARLSTVGADWARRRGHLQSACRAAGLTVELLDGAPDDAVAQW
ncbi:MAG TPA: tRNA (adenosine(37)-N6)-threonylcarbamoyltransferase complex ATPase subunit type 1 TsaE [Acidimicrobiales bacterium]|nr:tRNA (adenosine(37)-N6)-threonylcarbamoyltransferase complex ATPase subunit type 1 TsaE [Acidimicrobiales bacterium]